MIGKIPPVHWPNVQKVLPAVYGDELSYYELLAKMEKLVNDLIEQANAVGVEVNEFEEALKNIENIDDIDAQVQALQALADSIQETLEALPSYDEFTDLNNRVNTIATNKIPFPISPNSKYGTDGQVLRTNGDGTTQWQPPIVPTDQQAETYINAWLDEHPEATTTVQDGSLTTSKYANNSITDEKLVQSGGILDEVQNLQDYLTTFENSVRIAHNETVEVGTNSFDLEIPIARGTKVTFTNVSTNTAMSLRLVNADGTEESISTGVAPNNSITFIAPINAVEIRSYCNNTQWDFILEYGDGIVPKTEQNTTRVAELDATVYGASNTTLVTSNGWTYADFPLYTETYEVSFSDITQPLTVIGVYGIDENGTSTILATTYDFSMPIVFTPETNYKSIRYYVYFESTVGEVRIHIENKSIDERLEQKQDTLIAGANITIAGNVISSEGGSGGEGIGRYSVKDFGAVGDGIAIDTQAIQSCITAAEANGYEVYFPAGTYLIDDTIIIHFASICGSVAQDNNGANMENGVKILASTSDGMFRLMPVEGMSTYTVITIKNIVFDGRGTAEFCIFMDRRGASLYGVYCENALVGLKMTRIYNGIFIRSTFNNNRRYGIYMETACNNLMFLECLCGGNSRESENAYANVYASNPTGTPSLENSNIKFIGCELDAPYHDGAYNFVLNNCGVLVFDKNYFEGSKAGLFLLNDVQVLNITANYIVDADLVVTNQNITGSFIGNVFKLYNKQSGRAACNLRSDAIKGGNYIGSGYSTV